MLPVCAGLQKGSDAGRQQGHATKGQVVDPKTGISLQIKYSWWIQIEDRDFFINEITTILFWDNFLSL